MKRNILAALAVAAAALTASAQDYKVVVTTTDGEKHAFETSSLTDIKFNDAPIYLELTRVEAAEYNTYGGFGEYNLLFSTSGIDENAEPTDVGGMVLMLTLTTDYAENLTDMVVPTGYYYAGNGSKSMTFNIQKSVAIVRLQEGADGCTAQPIIGGTVDVRSENGTYDVRAELALMGAETAARYKGDIDVIANLQASRPFDKDQNVTVEGAQGRFYGNWSYPLADDMLLQLYTGKFDDGVQTEGYWFNIPINMPKVADPMNPEQHIADGVYTIDPREVIEYRTYLPFTLELGRLVDFMGIEYPIGTYVTYKGDKGDNRISYITSGTMTVSGNGTKIDIDFKTQEGVTIKATYSGDVNIKNFCDNKDKEIPVPDTLEKDYTLEFAPGDVAAIYPVGDYIKSGVYMFQIQVGDPKQEKGDFLNLEVCCDQQVLADGTYTINDEVANGCGMRGRIDPGAQLFFSSFGDLSSTVDGVQTVQAAIWGGSFTFTKVGDDQCKMVFNFESRNGHKITGTYEGKMTVGFDQ